MPERMPKLPENTNFPQDYTKHHEFYYNFTMISEFASTGLDFLIPFPPIIEPELQLTFEDDQQIMDDILDLSKPKGLTPTPQRTEKDIQNILKETPYQQSLSKLLEKANTKAIRHFYYGNSEEIRLNFLMRYL